jgi:hypothetical protein
LLVAYPHFQIPLNPPFLKGEISHNDLDRTTIKAAKIYKTGGLEIRIHSESVNKKMKDARKGIIRTFLMLPRPAGRVGVGVQKLRLRLFGVYKSPGCFAVHLVSGGL